MINLSFYQWSLVVCRLVCSLERKPVFACAVKRWFDLYKRNKRIVWKSPDLHRILKIFSVLRHVPSRKTIWNLLMAIIYNCIFCKSLFAKALRARKRRLCVLLWNSKRNFIHCKEVKLHRTSGLARFLFEQFIIMQNMTHHPHIGSWRLPAIA